MLGAGKVILLLVCLTCHVGAILKGTAITDYANQASFVVALMDVKDGRLFCTGTIISSQHLLTAASCWLDVSSNVAVRTHVNAIAGSGNAELSLAKIRRVGSVKTHPSYNANNLQYHPSDVVDLAVVFLEDTFDWTDPSETATAIVIITESNIQLIGSAYGSKSMTTFGRTVASNKLQDIRNPTQYKFKDMPPDKSCAWDEQTYVDFKLLPISYVDMRYHFCCIVDTFAGPLQEDVGGPMITQAPFAIGPRAAGAVTNKPLLLGTYQGMSPGGVVGSPLANIQNLINAGLIVPTKDDPPGKVLTAIDFQQYSPPVNYYKFVSLVYWGPWIQATSGILLPDQYWEGAFLPPSKPPKEVLWNPTLPKQQALVCTATCAQSASRSCWCDPDCEANGDCCSDYSLRCEAQNQRNKDTNARTDLTKQGQEGCAIDGICGQKKWQMLV